MGKNKKSLRELQDILRQVITHMEFGSPRDRAGQKKIFEEITCKMFLKLLKL